VTGSEAGCAATDLTGLLVGYGSIGRRHLANLHGLGVSDWAVVHSGAGTLPFDPPCPVRTYANLSEALQAEAPAFAVIANPTALHLPSALACVERGCDLLLEKPVSHTIDGLDTLSREVTTRGNKVLVGFQFRFDRGLRKVGELLRARAVGAPLHVRVVWGEYLPGWHPWEDWRASYAARRDLGGGVHHTLCHPLDYLRMLLGDPTGLTASLVDHGPLGLEVAEAADVTLRFPAGVSAQVHLDYWSRPTTHRVEIVCTDGVIVWDHSVGELRVGDGAAAAWQSEPFPGAGDRDELFLSEARHLLDVIGGRAEPACTLDDGAQVVRLCAAIERSAARTEAQLTEER
jgi:predicted dehydrogenase